MQRYPAVTTVLQTQQAAVTAQVNKKDFSIRLLLFFLVKNRIQYRSSKTEMMKRMDLNTLCSLKAFL
jgi:hypothetical protein